MMLKQFDYLKTPLGQIIAVVAMVDDVASLVILAILDNLQEDEGEAAVPDRTTQDLVWLVFQPILVRCRPPLLPPPLHHA
jgi:Kef-type K+ transport system membrane component KefB